MKKGNNIARKSNTSRLKMKRSSVDALKFSLNIANSLPTTSIHIAFDSKKDSKVMTILSTILKALLSAIFSSIFKVLFSVTVFALFSTIYFLLHSTFDSRTHAFSFKT